MAKPALITFNTSIGLSYLLIRLGSILYYILYYMGF